MSTLALELDRASTALRAQCRDRHGIRKCNCAVVLLADRLDERAAWVRELVQRCEERLSRASVQASIELSILHQLTGPIPAAETAPTERKEP